MGQGFRVWDKGLGFGVKGLGFGVLMFKGFGVVMLKVQRLGVGAQGLGLVGCKGICYLGTLCNIVEGEHLSPSSVGILL